MNGVIVVEVEKPSLDSVYLAHFGVKGMKWGRRKARPDEADRKATFSRNQKIALGVAGVVGAASAAYVLSKRGGISVRNGRIDPKSPFHNRFTVGKKAATFTMGKRSSVKVSNLPSPSSMMAEARLAGARNSVNQAGNQYLTDKTWRDSAKLTRSLRSTPDLKIPSVNDVRQKLSDSNYVWNL